MLCKHMQNKKLDVQNLMFVMAILSNIVNNYNNLHSPNDKVEREVVQLVVEMNNMKSSLSNMKFVCILVQN